MNKERIVSIQLFRILSCLGVFCVHLGQRLSLSGRIRTFTDFGSYGVILFFIISGFLASKGLYSGCNIALYYWKRVINLFPMYYFTIICAYIVENLIIKNQIPEDKTGLGWFRYIFLLNGFISDDTYFWSNICCTWTIPVFFFFYLVIPFVMKFIKEYKAALVFFISLFIILQRIRQIYSCTIIENLAFFFVGTFIFFCYNEERLVFSAILFITMTFFDLLTGRAFYHNLFAAIISVGLMKEVVFSSKLRKLIDFIDEHTYAFYLIQGIVFCELIDNIKTPISTQARITMGLLAMMASIVGCVIAHRFIEKPMQMFMKKGLSVRHRWKSI